MKILNKFGFYRRLKSMFKGYSIKSGKNCFENHLAVISNEISSSLEATSLSFQNYDHMYFVVAKVN